MSNKNFQTSVQLILKASAVGTPSKEAVLSLGPTPQYLLDHGFSQLDLIIKGSVVDKAYFDHGIPKGILERLGEIIANPKALYKSATVTSSAVVITLEQKNGSPILVPMHANRQVGRAWFNLVASVYIKESSIEERWTEKGLLLWHK